MFPDTPSRPRWAGVNQPLARSPSTGPGWQLVDCASTRTTAPSTCWTREPSVYASSYDNPEVRDAYPNADLIRQSINDAGPRPITPYYVGGRLDHQHLASPGAVNENTPAQTDEFMSAVRKGGDSMSTVAERSAK